MNNVARSNQTVNARIPPTPRGFSGLCDEDSLLSLKLRFLSLFFFYETSSSGLVLKSKNPSLVRISQLWSLSCDHPGLPVARILSNRFSQNPPSYPWVSPWYFSIHWFLLPSLAINPHFSLLHSESRPVSPLPQSSTVVVSWVKSSLLSLTSVRIRFPLAPRQGPFRTGLSTWLPTNAPPVRRPPARSVNVQGNIFFWRELLSN